MFLKKCFLKYFPILLILSCLVYGLSFIPEIQDLLISIGEMLKGRPLNKEYWHENIPSKIGNIFKISFVSVLLFGAIKLLKYTPKKASINNAVPLIHKRLDWLDIAKGIAIICTIIGHSFGKDRIGVFIFSFHIPLFFILSGYTTKKIPNEKILEASAKDLRRLIVPVFVVMFIDFLLQVFYLKNGIIGVSVGKITVLFWGTHNRGMGRLWFLVALFYSKFFFRIVLNNVSKYREIFLLIGTYIFSVPKLKIELPQNFDLLFVAMLFMDAGYHLRNSTDEDSSRLEKAGIAAFFIWTYLVWEKNIYTDLAMRLYSPLAIVAAFCGSLCVIQLSKVFECSTFMVKTLGFFGKWSLDLLCIHQLDGYWSNCLNYFSFQEGMKLARLNPYIHCVVNLIINILILLIWEGIKHCILVEKNKIAIKNRK